MIPLFASRRTSCNPIKNCSRTIGSWASCDKLGKALIANLLNVYLYVSLNLSLIPTLKLCLVDFLLALRLEPLTHNLYQGIIIISLHTGIHTLQIQVPPPDTRYLCRFWTLCSMETGGSKGTIPSCWLTLIKDHRQPIQTHHRNIQTFSQNPILSDV